MGWLAHRTPRNTLHVINTNDGSNFEAADQEEAQATIDAHTAAQEEKKRAEEEAARQQQELAPPVVEDPVLRVN